MVEKKNNKQHCYFINYLIGKRIKETKKEAKEEITALEPR